MSEKSIQEAADYIGNANKVLFITGAGISVDSDLPTYRGVGGLYDGKMTPDGIPIQEVMSGQTLRQNPALTWKYWLERVTSVHDKKPNRGHEIIAELQKRKRGSWVLTQNVDGLHADAGCDKNLIEIHGNANRLLCTKCDAHFEDRKAILCSDAVDPQNPPKCPICEAVLRLDVILFGEQLADENISMLNNLMFEGIEAVVSIGTSSRFEYIQAPMKIAYREKVPTIEINTEETDVSKFARCRIELGCTEALERIRKAMKI
ncbi:UNVERIFIED_CONTAM: hypothetical protein GTU68_001192 [Idotea baltica]|nr:hypothetical protein [Idotea baltica]